MLTKQDYLLTQLTEECAEVIQRVTKAQRFGLHETQPGQPLDNAQRILEEVIGIIVALEMLEDAKLLPQLNPRDPRIEEHKAKKIRYMEYARNIGALEPEERWKS